VPVLLIRFLLLVSLAGFDDDEDECAIGFQAGSRIMPE